jgi:hypothetical protein
LDSTHTAKTGLAKMAIPSKKGEEHKVVIFKGSVSSFNGKESNPFLERIVKQTTLE